MRPALFALLALLCACPKKAAAPPPATLPLVPKGFGAPFDGSAVLTVKDRALVLPSGKACLNAESCVEALHALQGQKLALELDGSTRMGELSGALAAFVEALPDDGDGCLEVSDGTERRCLRFRPFSGEDFGSWLDAQKPVGKIRIVMRADGMEVVADRGKVPGPDRYGPSLPPIEGRPDFQGLDDLTRRLKERFPDETEAGVAPSPGLPVSQAARALSSLSGPNGERFPKLFLVYP